MRLAADGCGVAGLVCCLVLGGGAGSAWAAPAWLAPQDLSAAGQHAYDPQVAVDGQGNAIAVWQRFDGTSSIVQAAVLAVGGSFGAPQDVSAAGQHAYDPQVAVDGRGNAIAVWSASNGTNFIVQAAARAAGGSFGVPQDVSAAGQDAGFPQVAVDGRGNAIAVWSRFDGTNFIMQAAARVAASRRCRRYFTPKRGGSFGAPQDLSAAGQDAFNPQVAFDGQGNAIAVWHRFDAGTNTIVQAAARVAASRRRRRYFTPKRGGSFGAPQDLSAAGQSASFSEVAVDGRGNAIAVWRRFDGTNTIVQAAVRAAGGSFGAPQDLSAAGQKAGFPEVAVDGRGNAIAVWQRFDGTNFIVQAAVRAAGGSFGAPQDLSDAGQDAQTSRRWRLTGGATRSPSGRAPTARTTSCRRRRARRAAASARRRTSPPPARTRTSRRWRLTGGATRSPSGRAPTARTTSCRRRCARRVRRLPRWRPSPR